MCVCECGLIQWVCFIVSFDVFNIILTSSVCAVIQALVFRGVYAARETDDARLTARVRKKVLAELAQARVWAPQFASLSPALADRKLCEYTRVLQLSALEQRVYAGIEAEVAAPEPVGRWKKYLAWLTVAGITLYPMCVMPLPPPPSHRRHRRVFPHRLVFLTPRRCLHSAHRACASASLFCNSALYNRATRLTRRDARRAHLAVRAR